MNVCLNCGIPIDAGIFDDSAIINITTPGEASPGGPQASLLPGEALELARFDLSPEHCGVLLSFAQYTDQYAASVKNVLTPGYLWEIRYDDQPLAPWLRFDRVINPWGLAGFPMAVRLQAESRLRLVIRNQNVPPTDSQHWLRQVGGRLVGRYWFDDEHAGRRPVSTREPWR